MAQRTAHLVVGKLEAPRIDARCKCWPILGTTPLRVEIDCLHWQWTPQTRPRTNEVDCRHWDRVD